MCGIVGFSKIDNVNNDFIDNGIRLLRHRGPDDNGSFYSDDKLNGLAHTRLSILDLSNHGHQPMVDESNQYVIVFNGEIYNFKEIKDELIQHYSFSSNSDTEVVLYAYIHYGIEFLEKLNGIFSIAIYDKKTKNILIARDKFGVKPLYYTFSQSGFYFASELKVLMTLDDLNLEFDYAGIESYMTYLWSPGSSTLLKSIKKLEQGTYMTLSSSKIIEEGSFKTNSYNEKFDLNFDELVNEVDNKLKAAVERQMVSDVPVGAFLSGGLDSSSIVSYAKNTAGKDFPTFTINTKNDLGMADDYYYAQKVSKHLSVKLHEINISHEMFFDLENMIYYLDEPQADLAPLLVSYISKIARNDYGIKVLLSGAGGDDIFSGYRRHYALKLDEKISKIPQVMRKTLKGMIQELPSSGNFLRRLKKYTRYFDLDGNEKIITYFQWIDQENRRKLYNKDFLSKLEKSYSNVDSALERELNSLDKNTSPLNKMLHLDRTFFLTDHNLNYTDKMGMKESVEIRVPLLDNELVDFVSTIPSKYKQNGKEGKYIFKKVMEKYLPNEVIYRPKTGFGTPLKNWIHNELKDYINTILSRKNIEERGIFDYDNLQEMILKDKLGKEDYSYIILSILSIELWCKIFIDNRKDLKKEFRYEKTYFNSIKF